MELLEVAMFGVLLEAINRLAEGAGRGELDEAPFASVSIQSLHEGTDFGK
jgi:hypothetical protein